MILIQPKFAETSHTKQYTSSNVITYIDNFTATNNTGNNVTLEINILDGDSAQLYNRIMAPTVIVPGECYICSEIMGKSINPGYSISTLASDANSITIMATGRQIT